MGDFGTFLRWWGIGIAAALALLAFFRWLWAPRCDAFGCRRRAVVEGYKAPSWGRALRWCREHSDGL